MKTTWCSFRRRCRWPSPVSIVLLRSAVQAGSLYARPPAAAWINRLCWLVYTLIRLLNANRVPHPLQAGKQGGCSGPQSMLAHTWRIGRPLGSRAHSGRLGHIALREHASAKRLLIAAACREKADDQDNPRRVAWHDTVSVVAR